MRLLDLNIAIKMPNTVQVIEFLKSQDADFIALQETVQPLEGSVYPEYQTHTDIEQALRLTHPYGFFGPIWVGDAFRGQGIPECRFGGHIQQGLDIFSKHAFVGGTHEFFYKHFEYMIDWSNWRQEDHGRAVQIALFEIEGRPLQLLNLHGIWTHDKRDDDRTLAQCQYLVEAARRREIPTIITGDFNLLPDTDSIQIMSDSFRNLIREYDVRSTRPAFRDELDTGGKVIDYMFVSDDIEVRKFGPVQVSISDHLPLVLDFEIK